MASPNIACSVDGCESPKRKRGWCASHYAQWRRTGADPVPFKHKWAPRQPCVVCGSPSEERGLRQFCSSACRALFVFHAGDVPSQAECQQCGGVIDLTERGSGGQRRKAATKLCKPCKADYRNHGSSVEALAERDGSVCRLCGDPVDLGLSRSDSLMCASVDHVVPRASGGGHEESNLQLAHLRCNMLKRDRMELV